MPAFLWKDVREWFQDRRGKGYDVNWLIRLLLGLPMAMLATLNIIDWGRKRWTGNLAVHDKEQSRREPLIKSEEQPSPVEPTDQAISPIIRQAEMAAEVEWRIVEDLRYYEVEHRH